MMTRNGIRAASGAAAVLLVAAGFWAGKSLTTATLTPIVQTGTVGLVGDGGGEFTILLSGQREPVSYGMPSDVNWRDAYGIWQQGTQPGCMPSLSHGQRITIGVVNAAPVGDAPGGPMVVWIECPAKPIPSYPVVTPGT